jgi:hypothetical protein
LRFPPLAMVVAAAPICAAPAPLVRLSHRDPGDFAAVSV